jgi:hypothetical protein
LNNGLYQPLCPSGCQPEQEEQEEEKAEGESGVDV